MVLRWIKKGHIFAARDNGLSYGKARAFLLLDNLIRCYPICYQTRDAHGMTRSMSYRLDLDREHPERILFLSDTPILPLGGRGAFDEFGIMAECVVVSGDDVYLYYDGWTRCPDVPYNWAIGLAISRDNGVTFEKFGPEPVVGATISEPFLQAAPTVMIDYRGLWHMWYLSGTEWRQANGVFENRYLIMHGTSANGIDWKRDGRPILPAVFADECQAGATVFWHKDRYHMIFSFRHGSDFHNAERGYRLGYAHSADLETWQRDDAELIISSGTKDGDWDTEMNCYPCVITANEHRFLFYSGNDCGATGFGYAEMPATP